MAARAKVDRSRGGSKLLTPSERQLADRVARARAATPPRDPTSEHHASCADIARETGVDVVDVLDTWDERASIREWDGGLLRVDAERLAVDDTRAIYVDQHRLKLG